MPVLDGKWRNSSIAASNPPADPPIPTIGQAKSFCFEGDVRRAYFAPPPLAFAFARDAFFCPVRFAAMAVLLMLIAWPGGHQHCAHQRGRPPPGPVGVDAACAPGFK